MMMFPALNMCDFLRIYCSRFQEWSDTITDDLDPSKKTLCLCHHGMRSGQVRIHRGSSSVFRAASNEPKGIVGVELMSSGRISIISSSTDDRLPI